MIQDSPVVQKWIDQGIKKSLEKDIEKIEKGKVIMAQELLFIVMEERFGIITQKIVDEIKKIESPVILKFLLRRTLKIKSIDEFYEILEKVKGDSL